MFITYEIKNLIIIGCGPNAVYGLEILLKKILRENNKKKKKIIILKSQVYWVVEKLIVKILEKIFFLIVSLAKYL